MSSVGGNVVNTAIQTAANAADVCLWQVAEEMGVSTFTLSTWLRHELSPDRTEEVMTAIRKIERRMKQ